MHKIFHRCASNKDSLWLWTFHDRSLFIGSNVICTLCGLIHVILYRRASTVLAGGLVAIYQRCYIILTSLLPVFKHFGCIAKGERWGLLRIRPLISPLRKVLILLTDNSDALKHVHIWQVSPQLSCGDTSQIWMWYWKSNALVIREEMENNGREKMV